MNCDTSRNFGASFLTPYLTFVLQIQANLNLVFLQSVVPQPSRCEHLLTRLAATTVEIWASAMIALNRHASLLTR